MKAQVFMSKKHNVWRVVQGGDVLSEWQTEEVARAYCEGYNAAIAEMEPMVAHNCIRGITENINKLHSDLNKLMIKKPDHLDGLKYALQVIDEVENRYIAMGINHHENDKDPFHDIRNRIRMLLGLPFIERE